MRKFSAPRAPASIGIRADHPAALPSRASRFSRLSLAAMLALAGASFTAGAQPSAATADGTSVIPGRILLLPNAGLPAANLHAALAAAGAWGARRITSHGLHLAEVPEGLETAIANRLAQNRQFKLVAPDLRVPPALVTNDPLLGSTWQLTKTGAFSAWDTTQGSGVTIAILDSGVDLAHPDLKPNLVAGWNFDSGNADASDVYGHGTKVAGAAAAAANNGLGGAGMASGAKIMPIRVTDTAGMGSVSAIAQGLTWAADNGARVANVSFLVAGNATVQSAAQYMQNKGGLVFVSAGNSGALDSAAPSTALVTVGSTESNDSLSSFSNYGSGIDLVAPGGSIYTTIKGGLYGTGSGTSYASPVAAGAAALVFAARPGLTPANVESLLKATAVDLGATGVDIYFGAGRVNAAAAVAAALATPTVADTTPPTAAITSPAASGTVSGTVPVSMAVTDNVGVVRVDLQVNGMAVVSDLAAPFAFSWDTTTLANGMANLAVKACDAAGNCTTSTAVAVNVANNLVADTTPPVVVIKNPTGGSTVKGIAGVAGAASDNLGAAGVTQTLSIDGKVVATTVGGSLSYSWNTRKATVGSHVIKLVGKDAAGNATTTSATVNVSR